MKPLVVLLPALLLWLLAFEVAASIWSQRVDYLLATDLGGYVLEAVRWTGWVPLAAAFLWVRERMIGAPAAMSTR